MREVLQWFKALTFWSKILLFVIYVVVLVGSIWVGVYTGEAVYSYKQFDRIELPFVDSRTERKKELDAIPELEMDYLEAVNLQFKNYDGIIGATAELMENHTFDEDNVLENTTHHVTVTMYYYRITSKFIDNQELLSYMVADSVFKRADDRLTHVDVVWYLPQEDDAEPYVTVKYEWVDNQIKEIK